MLPPESYGIRPSYDRRSGERTELTRSAPVNSLARRPTALTYPDWERSELVACRHTVVSGSGNCISVSKCL